MRVWLDQEKSEVHPDPNDVDESDLRLMPVESPKAPQASAESLDKEYLSVDDLCAYLDVTKNTVYDWRKKGTIPYTKVGRHLRFSKKETDRWLRKRSEKEI